MGFQVLWAKTISIGLGREYPSVISSSTAFLGGMALGAWLLHGWRRARIDPFRLFVILECLSAAWMVLLVVVSPVLHQHFPLWIGLSPSPARHWAVALAVPFLLMLPVSLGQGVSILLLRNGLTSACPSQPLIAGLYAANTVGGLGGLLLATFLLLPDFGCRQTAWILAGVNGITALIAWIGCPSRKTLAPAPTASISIAQHDSECTLAPAAWRALFLSGFLGVGYQMLVVRGLSRFLENTVFTFATTLAVYLGSGALGAAWNQKRQPRRNPDHPLINPVGSGVPTAPSPEVASRHRSGALGTARPTAGGSKVNQGSTESRPTMDGPCLIPINALAALMGSGIYGVVALSLVGPAYHSLRLFFGDAVGSVIAAEFIIVSMVSAPVCFWMGYVFCGLWSQNTGSSKPAPSLAALYAANLLGAAIGPAFIGLYLLKLTGIRTALLIVSAAYFFVAPSWRLWGWRAGPVLVAAVIAAVIPFEKPPATDKILASIEGPSVHASVVESPNGHRTLRVNQRFQMGGTGAVTPQRRQAHIPLLLHPRPQSALFLGMGTGITFAASTVHPDLSGDSVELLPEVAQLRPYFEPYSALPEAPGFRVFISDARRFVLTIDKHYDVIVADLFHPALSGSGALYTREHFQAIKALLAPDGLFCQWIPMHQVDKQTFNCIVHTFLHIFPEANAVMLRFAVDAPVVGLVGGKFPVLSEGWVESRLSNPPLAEQLKALSLADTVRLQGCYLADAATLGGLTDGSPINTDDNQWIAFHAPAFSFQQEATSYGRFMDLVRQAPAGSPFIISTQARRFIEARNVYLNGLVLESEKKVGDALRAYVESARISPDFSLGYAQCLSLIPLLAKAQPQLTQEILRALMEARPEQSIARDLLQRMTEGGR